MTATDTGWSRPPQPAAVWVLRHGESVGNVARDAAETARTEIIDLAERDMDVPLSDQGLTQAAAFGRWLAEQPAPAWPVVVYASPYVRAEQTARTLLAAAGPPLSELPVHVDERLRERELGVLDLLTHRGVAARFPEEEARRRRIGKFYHRPAGGESWADVALRLRVLRQQLWAEQQGRRLLLVSHEVVVFLLRYLLEEWSEAQVLACQRETTLANCSLCAYDTAPSGRLELERFNWTAPVTQHGAEITEESDAPVAPR